MNERIELESRLLQRIKSKINPDQTAQEKEKILSEAFLEFCAAAGVSDCLAKAGLLKDNDLFFKDFKGYGAIDSLLNDPEVEDIIINGISPIYIHHAREGFKKTDKRFTSISELELLIEKLTAFSGSQDLKKIKNVDLPGMRGRVNIVYSPTGPDLTITRIKTVPLSIVDLINMGTINSSMSALLWLYIEGLGIRPANILISGGPGSGKTTLLNAILGFIPFNEHTVVIEDSLELVTDWIENASRLQTSDELSLTELVKNSLRMRPERIIVGEVRASEAQDMVTAMNTGKYCMATMHAASVRETILRLQSHPMNVPETLLNLIDVFVIMKKNASKNSASRVVSEIAETAGMEQKTVLISPLWKYDFGSNNFVQLEVSTVYRDRIALASGKNPRQIMEEIERRRLFLENLVKTGVRSIKEISYRCHSYAHP